MLDGLYTSLAGMSAEQEMLDVTGDNISNSSTVGYKSSTVDFAQALAQTQQSATVSGAAGIGTNFSSGAQTSTGVATNVMINGNGFFAVNSGSQTLYTRAGAFSFNASGQLVNPDGAQVQGWMASAAGTIATGSTPTGITIPNGMTSTARTTTSASFTGNLDSSAATGTSIERDLTVYSANGPSSTLPLTFTKTASGWDVNDGTSDLGAIDYSNGSPTGTSTLTSSSGISLNFSGTTGYASDTTAAVSTQNGCATGALSSYTVGSDGSITGNFSNGQSTVLARIAVAQFANQRGLTAVGSAEYTASSASGAASYTSPGQGGSGLLISGSVEASNVDLSSEFTNLITSQRGFQANARMITTIDTVLQEINALTQS